MQAKHLSLACLLAACVATGGCSLAQESPPIPKDKLVKTGPPPQWRGPGEPGGPPNGAGAAPKPPPSKVLQGTGGK